MSDQIVFGTDDFAQNPEPRCPCLLVLDRSGSMHGAPIQALNQGLVTFRDELSADALAAKRVEVAVVSFGPAMLESDFTTVGAWTPPSLSASGDTPMGQAITMGLSVLEQRKQTYRANGIAFYRPWVFLITDGAPTDPWQQAAAQVREGETTKKFSFFAVGVQGANLDVLRQISVREPLTLDGLRFRDLFVWLSSSMRSLSTSTPNSEVPLANPAAPGGWASVTS